MPIEEFLESGKYDEKRYPIAAQIDAHRAAGPGMHSKSIIGSSETTIENQDQVIEQLWTHIEALNRAVALLEDQLNELRGSYADPKKNSLP